MTMQRSVPTCNFLRPNNQCIGQRCPFAPVNRRKSKPKVALVCVPQFLPQPDRRGSRQSPGRRCLRELLRRDGTKPQINPDAVRLMKQVYGIDMEATQHSKLLADLPAWTSS